MKNKILPILWLTLAGYAGYPQSPNEDQLVSDWLYLQQQLIRATKGVPHVAYSRHFAYTSIAVYEAMVNGNSEYQTLAGQLPGLNSLPKPPKSNKYCWSCSGNAAFAMMFKTFYEKNSKTYLIDSLESVCLSRFQQNGYSKDAVDQSVAYGKSIAQAVLSWAGNDGFGKERPPYQPLTGEDKWSATPPAFSSPAVPYWMEHRLMVLSTANNKSLKPPFTYSKDKNSAFHNMASEVYQVSKNLTEEQKNIAWFWDDSPNGKYLSVFGHWASILAQLIDEKKLTNMAAAEAFAKMSISQYDAAIACWKGKYEYAVLRPITFIQKYIDASWAPLIETPPHPEYPAAHATFSAAAATALTNVFGSIAFVDHTYDALGYKARSFNNLEGAAREAGMSRLYGGIHYRPSIDSGLLLGNSVASEVINKLRFKNPQ